MLSSSSLVADATATNQLRFVNNDVIATKQVKDRLACERNQKYC